MIGNGSQIDFRLNQERQADMMRDAAEQRARQEAQAQRGNAALAQLGRRIERLGINLQDRYNQ